MTHPVIWHPQPHAAFDMASVVAVRTASYTVPSVVVTLASDVGSRDVYLTFETEEEADKAADQGIQLLLSSRS